MQIFGIFKIFLSFHLILDDPIPALCLKGWDKSVVGPQWPRKG